MAGKRKDYISWDTYFMLVALIASERSKDPRTQVGAVIVKDNHILSVGYNGTVKGMSDDDMPWDSLGEETGDLMNIKDSFVIHGEANSLEYLPFGTNLDGAILYVTLSPCIECAKRIANSGIRKVIYLERYRKEKKFQVSKYILEKANITLEPLENVSLLKHGLVAVMGRLENLKLENTKSQNIRKIEYRH